jgi:hypothetical protein
MSVLRDVSRAMIVFNDLVGSFCKFTFFRSPLAGKVGPLEIFDIHLDKPSGALLPQVDGSAAAGFRWRGGLGNSLMALGLAAREDLNWHDEAFERHVVRLY